MPIAYLALGSNLGNREGYIQSAINNLKKNSITILKESTIIETNPVGGVPQGKYLNSVIKVQTTLSPLELLNSINTIEATLGRTREIPNGPRTIDIDILLYENESIHTEKLTIPHPRMKERDFVMNPLKEIEPSLKI